MGHGSGDGATALIGIAGLIGASAVGIVRMVRAAR